MEAKITAKRTEMSTSVKMEGKAGELLDLVEDVVAGIAVAVNEGTGDSTDFVIDNLMKSAKENAKDRVKEKDAKEKVKNNDRGIDELFEDIERVANDFGIDIPEEVAKSIKQNKKAKDLLDRAEKAKKGEFKDILKDAIKLAEEIDDDDKKS